MRVTGRVSAVVIEMKLAENDIVVGMQLDDMGDFLLIISELGKGKKTRIEEFSPQKRGGKGVKCYKENDNNEKTGSGFSFQNELLSERTYEFLKDKDECLGDVNLDDNIPGDKEDNKSKGKDRKQKKYY